MSLWCVRESCCRGEPGAVLLAVLFSALVKIGFGYYLTRNAAYLDPIEALRSEWKLSPTLEIARYVWGVGAAIQACLRRLSK